MTITKSNFMKQNRCADPDCELFDGEDADGETEGDAENDAKPPRGAEQILIKSNVGKLARRPRNGGITSAVQVSSNYPQATKRGKK
jgi:hypothetical protein